MIKLSVTAKALAIIVVLYLVADILLTPVGFETRPVNGITTLGLATLALIFIGFALVIVALAFLFRNPRRSSTFAILGLLLYFPAFIVDRTGLFAAQASPTAITVVEIVQAVIAVVGILLAWRLSSEKPLSPQTATRAIVLSMKSSELLWPPRAVVLV